MKEWPEGIARRRTLLKKMGRFAGMQKRNWQKHFADHPEQLLPGAKVERTVPAEEMELLAQIIGADLFVKSSRGRSK